MHAYYINSIVPNCRGGHFSEMFNFVQIMQRENWNVPNRSFVVRRPSSVIRQSSTDGCPSSAFTQFKDALIDANDLFGHIVFNQVNSFNSNNLIP